MEEAPAATRFRFICFVTSATYLSVAGAQPFVMVEVPTEPAFPVRPKELAMNANFRNFALWVIIGLVLIALFNLFQNTGQHVAGRDVAYSQFMSDVSSGKVRTVVIAGQQITGTYSDNTSFQTFAPDDPQLVPKLEAQNVSITARPLTEAGNSLLGMLISWFPMFLILAVWIFFMRQMQGTGGKALGFGKSKAKLLTEAHGRVTFEDVAGVDEAKEDLQEIVEFLRDPQKFQRLGGRIRGAACC